MGEKIYRFPGAGLGPKGAALGNIGAIPRITIRGQSFALAQRCFWGWLLDDGDVM